MMNGRNGEIKNKMDAVGHVTSRDDDVTQRPRGGLDEPQQQMLWPPLEGHQPSQLGSNSNSQQSKDPPDRVLISYFVNIVI